MSFQDLTPQQRKKVEQEMLRDGGAGLIATLHDTLLAAGDMSSTETPLRGDLDRIDVLRGGMRRGRVVPSDAETSLELSDDQSGDGQVRRRGRRDGDDADAPVSGNGRGTEPRGGGGGVDEGERDDRKGRHGTSSTSSPVRHNPSRAAVHREHDARTTARLRSLRIESVAKAREERIQAAKRARAEERRAVAEAQENAALRALEDVERLKEKARTASYIALEKERRRVNATRSAAEERRSEREFAKVLTEVRKTEQGRAAARRLAKRERREGIPGGRGLSGAGGAVAPVGGFRDPFHDRVVWANDDPGADAAVPVTQASRISFSHPAHRAGDAPERNADSSRGEEFGRDPRNRGKSSLASGARASDASHGSERAPTSDDGAGVRATSGDGGGGAGSSIFEGVTPWAAAAAAAAAATTSASPPPPTLLTDEQAGPGDAEDSPARDGAAGTHNGEAGPRPMSGADSAPRSSAPVTIKAHEVLMDPGAVGVDAASRASASSNSPYYAVPSSTTVGTALYATLRPLSIAGGTARSEGNHGRTAVGGGGFVPRAPRGRLPPPHPSSQHADEIMSRRHAHARYNRTTKGGASANGHRRGGQGQGQAGGGSDDAAFIDADVVAHIPVAAPSEDPAEEGTESNERARQGQGAPESAAGVQSSSVLTPQKHRDPEDMLLIELARRGIEGGSLFLTRGPRGGSAAEDSASSSSSSSPPPRTSLAQSQSHARGQAQSQSQQRRSHAQSRRSQSHAATQGPPQPRNRRSRKKGKSSGGRGHGRRNRPGPAADPAAVAGLVAPAGSMGPHPTSWDAAGHVDTGALPIIHVPKAAVWAPPPPPGALPHRVERKIARQISDAKRDIEASEAANLDFFFPSRRIGLQETFVGGGYVGAIDDGGVPSGSPPAMRGAGSTQSPRRTRPVPEAERSRRRRGRPRRTDQPEWGGEATAPLPQPIVARRPIVTGRPRIPDHILASRKRM